VICATVPPAISTVLEKSHVVARTSSVASGWAFRPAAVKKDDAGENPNHIVAGANWPDGRQKRVSKASNHGVCPKTNHAQPAFRCSNQDAVQENPGGNSSKNPRNPRNATLIISKHAWVSLYPMCKYTIELVPINISRTTTECTYAHIVPIGNC
jgi:hypothetical protein